MTAYIIKSSVSLLLMFGLYWFLLRKEKLFVFNRFFLVASVVFSLVVPFISIPVNFHVTPLLNDIIPAYDYVIPEISTAENIVTGDVNISLSYVEKETSIINISAILLALYISGVILFLFRFLRNIYVIIRRSKLSEKISFKGYRIVLTNDKSGPCCFFNSIFLNREDYLNGRIDKELLDHELEHARQSHTIDIILIELVKIFYWFNPVHVLYERAIRINHEYLADNGVINDNSDIKTYTDKLLSFITDRRNMSLTSGSSHSSTKKRLLMMTKTKSKSSVCGLRITTTLCLILVFSLLLSFKQSNIQPSNNETDSGGLTDLQSQTVKDIDGNIYKTVTNGNYVWMAENLKATKYNDGTNISLVTDDEQWQKYEPAYCWYDNKEAENKNKYGALYNWYAVNTKKLCPIGWRVPSKEDLVSLITFTPRDTLTGGKLKETGFVNWKIPNKGATNETGFTALSGGVRNYNGNFGLVGEQGVWWTSSEENDFIGFVWILTYNDSRVQPGWPSKRDGFSVRCIRDYSQVTSNSSINSGEMSQNLSRGIVLTEDGKPLFGATITTTGKENTLSKATTDSDGRFKMTNIQTGTSILIEYRGFKGKTLKADFSSEMVVKLERDPDYKGRIFIPEIQNVNFRNSDFTPAKALVVTDGVIIDNKGDFKVNPGEIKSFKVLTDKEAINKYGDKGRDGVVEIVLNGNKIGSKGRKPSNSISSDTSKYNTLLSVNHVSNKGELIDIPVSNLQYIGVWTYLDINKVNKKGLRTIGIMTRDFYKVKGTIVSKNGKPLSGVSVSVRDNPVKEISDKDGRFEIEDVRENALLEFSHPGFKPYYINTSFVPFTMELTIELEKDNDAGKDVIDKEVTYKAAGYIKNDIINKKVVILTGEAIVKYGNIEIKADSIVFDKSRNQLLAVGRLDKFGKIIGKPVFKEGTREFESDELIYNFETRKALIKNIKQ